MRRLSAILFVVLFCGCMTGPERRAERYDYELGARRTAISQLEGRLEDLNAQKAEALEAEEPDEAFLRVLDVQINHATETRDRLKREGEELKEDRDKADEHATESRRARAALMQSLLGLALVGVKTFGGAVIKGASAAT